MSPIHWKCVPQIKSLIGKHCAAVCGVIIRKKRPKLKRIHDLQNRYFGVKCEPADVSEPIDSPKVAEEQPIETQPECIIDTVAVSSELNEKQMKTKTDTPSPLKIQMSAHSSPCKNLVTSPLRTDHNASCVSDKVAPLRMCRYCLKAPALDEKLFKKTCPSCNAIIHAFFPNRTMLEDLTCLRDLPCPTQWPMYWVPTEDVVSKLKEKRCVQEFGPIGEQWCTSCKVAHLIKLGFTLNTYFPKRISSQHPLRSINIHQMEEPEFQHRGRERRSVEYLQLLSHDVGSLGPLPIAQGLLSPSDSEQLQKRSDVARFLDSLWARPLHLLSLSQLSAIENHSVEDETILPNSVPSHPVDSVSSDRHESVIDKHISPLNELSDAQTRSVCSLFEGSSLTNSKNQRARSLSPTRPTCSHPDEKDESLRSIRSLGDIPSVVQANDTQKHKLLTTEFSSDSVRKADASQSVSSPSPTSVKKELIKNISTGQTLLDCQPDDDLKPIVMDTNGSSTEKTNADPLDIQHCDLCAYLVTTDEMVPCIQDVLARKLLKTSRFVISLGPSRTCSRPKRYRVSQSTELIISELKVDNLVSVTKSLSESESPVDDGAPSPVTVSSVACRPASPATVIEECEPTLDPVTSKLPSELEAVSVEMDVPCTDSTDAASPHLNSVSTNPSPHVPNSPGNEPIDGTEPMEVIPNSPIPIVEVSPEDLKNDASPLKRSPLNQPICEAQSPVNLCGTCLLRLRKTITHLVSTLDAPDGDLLTELLCEPSRYCTTSSPVEQSTLEGCNPTLRTASSSCMSLGLDRLCPACYTYQCLQYLFTRLCPGDEADPKTVSPTQSSDEDGEFILPLGGPLILPQSTSEDCVDMQLFKCYTPPGHLLTSSSDETNRGAISCLCCQTQSDFLSYYRVDSKPNGRQICSGCLWTLKTAIGGVAQNPAVLRLAKRLNSVASTHVEFTMPLLSEASRQTLSDTARLACLLSKSCQSSECSRGSIATVHGDGCETTTRVPLWLSCPACVTRRCHRLLPRSISIRPPMWYRRRLCLLNHSQLLEDLDPRILWPHLEPGFTDKNASDPTTLRLVDVEFTTAVIERWLVPPKPPVSERLEDGEDASKLNCSDIEQQPGETDHDDSDSESQASTCLWEESSAFSSSSIELLDHVSEYGGETWWEKEDTVLEDDDEAVDAAAAAAETVPDVISAAAADITDSSREEKDDSNLEINDNLETTDDTILPSQTLEKRQRKPTAKVLEAEADAMPVRKSTRPRLSHSRGSLDHSASDTLDETTNTLVSPSKNEDAKPEQTEPPSEIPTPPQSPTKDQLELHQPSDNVQEETKLSDANPPHVSPVKPILLDVHTEEEELPLRATKTAGQKRKIENNGSELIVRGKRRLKMNHRFLDGYDGNFPCLTGEDRRVREDSSSGADSVSGGASHVSRGRKVVSTPASRTSLMAKKLVNAGLNKRGRQLTSLLRPKSRSKLTISSDLLADSSEEFEEDGVSVESTQTGGPRVKQTSRPALKPEENRYAPALSAMVHAARLAAVGAKIPGGTSPTHAALAVTARVTAAELNEDVDSNGSDLDTAGGEHDGRKASVTSRASDKPGGSLRNLPDRCGQCPACCGVIQPCGRCNNCQMLQKMGKRTSTARPCKELICFRRRPDRRGSVAGPRVKLPSNFVSSPNVGYQASTPAVCRPNNGETMNKPFYHTSNSQRDSIESTLSHTMPSTTTTSATTRKPNGSIPTNRNGHKSISLFDTVPGLSQQLELDAWHSSNNGSTQSVSSTIAANGRVGSDRSWHRGGGGGRVDSLNVHADKALAPIVGGDLGMRFATTGMKDKLDDDHDCIRPVEGEIVTNDLAHSGGYAIVTTLAAAPPKEICYACGSGGGQLLFCVSCAEPFHFYCVERQFRPRRKDLFICRNCTKCDQCSQPAADLRCIRCTHGFHPNCLPHYAPAQSGQRGNWVCPTCTSCFHCSRKPGVSSETNDPADPTASDSKRSQTAPVLWSSEPGKCASCSQAQSRGDICPECDRAYLPTTKQMIQCDTCQLWMHRTCVKLTADEYEWIARLPPGRLNKYVVNCTVCQSERRQVDNQPDPVPSTGTDDTSRLRTVAKDTLMTRMTDLVNRCSHSSEAGGESPTAVGQPQHQTGLARSISSQITEHSSSNNGHGMLPESRFIPQLDGNFDHDPEEEINRRLSKSLVKPSINRTKAYTSICAHAADVLLNEHSSSHMSVPPRPKLEKPSPHWSARPSKSWRPEKMLVANMEDARYRGGGRGVAAPTVAPSNPHTRHLESPSWQNHFAPPIKAGWATEHESEKIWISPRSLLYRLLTRILHRLAAHPVNSPKAHALRRLLRWLSTMTQHAFPWLNVTEMANDVRDVLRQANGEFVLVLDHFNKCALIEMYELLCPTVARLVDKRLFTRPPISTGMSTTNSSSSVVNTTTAEAAADTSGEIQVQFYPWNNLTTIDTCLTAILHHLRTSHPGVATTANALPGRNPCTLAGDARLVVAAVKAAVEIAPPQLSQCHRPHQMEQMDWMRSEAREERWVEHWSAVEEDLVLGNFQRHLLRNWKAGRRKPTSKPPMLPLAQKPQQPTPAPQTPSNLVISDPMSLDLAFQDMDSVLQAAERDEVCDKDEVQEADEKKEKKKTPEEAALELCSFNEALPLGDLSMEFDTAAEKTEPEMLSDDEADRFYFALDEFWTAAMGKRHEALSKSRNAAVKVQGGENKEQLQDEDDADEEEDLRCCILCTRHGDNNIEGRLLFTGADTWVHVNCALWSNEVYEEETGQLVGLSDALRRARTSQCYDCGHYGATMVCSNAHESCCTLYNTPWFLPDNDDDDGDDDASFARLKMNKNKTTPLPKAVHFACALRRRLPLPRSLFTTDRSWFCSPECHTAATRQRLKDAVHSARSRRRKELAGMRLSRDLLMRDDEELILTSEEHAVLEKYVEDDMEPISLGELLICRRVFVPSDCFAASLYPPDYGYAHSVYSGLDDDPKVISAAREAVRNLATSPNSLALLQSTSGVPGGSLVLTVGSLRIDRLGEVREASDSLSMNKYFTSTTNPGHVKRSNYLCPINFRARRIYWSCYKVEDRISYTLHIKQTHAHLQGSTPTSTSMEQRLDYDSSSSLMSAAATINTPITPYETPSPPVPIAPKPCGNWASTVGASTNKYHSSAQSPLISLSSPIMTSSVHYTTGSVTSNPSSLQHPTGMGGAVGPLQKARFSAPMPQVACATYDRSISGAASANSRLISSVDGRSPVHPLHNAQMQQQQSLRIINTVSLSNPSASRHASPSGGLANKQPQSKPIQYHPAVSGSGMRHPMGAPAGGTVSTPCRAQFVQTNLASTPPLTRPRAIHHIPITQVQTTIGSNSAPPRQSIQYVRCPVNPTNQAGRVVSFGPRAGSVRPAIGQQQFPRTRLLTTPTKDLQLANQLNGLFQNLPVVNRLHVPKPAVHIVSTISSTLPSSHVRLHQTQELLPQLDGNYDYSDFDPDNYEPVRRRRGGSTNSSKRSRPPSSNAAAHQRNRWSRKRSRSVTSSDSGTSSRTAASGRRGSSSGRRGRPPLRFVANKHSRQSFLATSSTQPAVPVKRRWIAEREKQQELANLVSRAKQASHARLYQSEVEKHASSFRLRFVIEGIVRAAPNPTVAWRTVINRVAALRERHGLQPLVYAAANGWTQFGLNQRHVIFLVEQMCGASQCYRYRFRYHWRKIEHLRQKFTPPLPIPEGCTRAKAWTKPSQPSEHARDPLAFLCCKANPPPRPLCKPSVSASTASVASTSHFKSSQLHDNSHSSHTIAATGLTSPTERTKLLSPNEQQLCAEAARQAASLVAVQLKLPQHVREACVAQAVVQATGYPMQSERRHQSTGVGSPNLKDKDGHDLERTRSLETEGGGESESSDEHNGEETDMGTITTQFKRIVSGPLARISRVSVHPSRIHRRGLFSLRGFREDEMVIEYMGELIRNMICEQREVRYRAAGVDCYMFRIDEDLVIDATYVGNAARFINHCCDPNCYAKVILVDEKKHIVILAKRKIYPGEELTYDYRFPKESDKLLCNCGSFNCRKYLN